MDVKEKNFWIKHYSQLKGKTITEVHVDSEHELFALGFDDNTTAWILCDPEGNGPGFLEIENP